MVFAKTIAIIASFRGAAAVLVKDDVAFKSEIHAHTSAALAWHSKALTQSVSVLFPMPEATPPASLAEGSQTNQMSLSLTLAHCPHCAHHTEICFHSEEDVTGALQNPQEGVDEEFLKMHRVTLMSGDAVYAANMEKATIMSGKYCCTGTLPEPKANQFAITMCHHLPDGMSLAQDSKIVEAKVQDDASEEELSRAADQIARMAKAETKAVFKIADRIFPKASALLQGSEAQARMFSKKSFPLVNAAFLLKTTEPAGGPWYPDSSSQ